MLEQGAAHRRVYLPDGGWWDFWSDQRAGGEGGVEITREVDLSTIPLYVRAGAILPVGPVRQYVTEPSEDPVTLQIYPGADGLFSWYHDDGASFAYRQGKFSRIVCSWQDSVRKLTLTSSEGEIPPIARKVLVHAIDNGKTRTIPLTNQRTVIDL